MALLFLLSLWLKRANQRGLGRVTAQTNSIKMINPKSRAVSLLPREEESVNPTIQKLRKAILQRRRRYRVNRVLLSRRVFRRGERNQIDIRK
jgi:hypothetical protein